VDYELLEAVLAKGHEKGVASLNDAQHVAFFVADLDAEAAINGLAGYYDNSSGAFAREAANALERLGATESAALLREANALFTGAAPPADWEQRRAVLQTMDEATLSRIEELGAQYLSRPDNLGDKFDAFLIANQEALAV